MMNKPASSRSLTESRLRSWLAPHKIAMVIMWLVTTITMTVILINDHAGTNLPNGTLQTLHAVYVVVLLWYLVRTGPALNQLPGGHVPVKRWPKIGAWLTVLGMVMLYLLDFDFGLLILLSLIAFVPILLVWGRDLSLRLIIQAFALALFVYLAGSQWVKPGSLSKSWNSTLSVFTILFYISGGLLLKRTNLGRVQLLNGQYVSALKSVCAGSLLFVPLGLIDVLGDPILDLSVIQEWWMPLLLPWWSGISEETWYRLFLVGLVYFMLRPAFHKYPVVAVVAAVLFSGIVFGVGHGLTAYHFWTTGMLFGVPFAAIFVTRDWEHAVGAHYMVNMIPALVAFFLN